MGKGNVARGLVPRWGREGAWQIPPCEFAEPGPNTGFSYLELPEPTGPSDCYENMSRPSVPGQACPRYRPALYKYPMSL